jgi:hypothetical protein
MLIYRRSFKQTRSYDQKKAVQAYLEKVDKFLERLLLLIHMTGDQPPRGTELIGLQHNST